MAENENCCDLMFGIVGAVGINFSKISRPLTQELKKLGYYPKEIKVSSLFLKVIKKLKKVKGSEYDRILRHMKAGNSIRLKSGFGFAAAILAIDEMLQFKRTRVYKNNRNRTAFIINSLKHPDEVDFLRFLYGDSFFLISIYEPKKMRMKNLKDRILESDSNIKGEDGEKLANILDEIDQREPDNIFGQKVSDTFFLGDFFVQQNDDLPNQIKRFLELLFGNPFITPTKEEVGMFHAKAAALRSSDPSRQVGASIFTRDGDIITFGCNEVPKPGGGSFWAGDDRVDFDNRDFPLYEIDPSLEHKKRILSDVLARLIKKGWFAAKTKQIGSDKLAERAFKQNFFKGAGVSDILEFGRPVHAEMNAITDAAKRGLSLKDSMLYCTTFPCHICARHIIASGIKKVVYIEPYPKSRARDLYRDSIRVDGEETRGRKYVSFEPFIGVAPKMFFKFFQMVDRRNPKTGALLKKLPKKPNPRVYNEDRFEHVFISLSKLRLMYEKAAVSQIKEKLKY